MRACTVHKEFYGLDMRNNNVPDLSTETALAEWPRAQLGVAGDSLGGVEHLGHAGTLGALVANDDGVAGLDLVRQDRNDYC